MYAVSRRRFLRLACLVMTEQISSWFKFSRLPVSNHFVCRLNIFFSLRGAQNLYLPQEVHALVMALYVTFLVFQKLIFRKPPNREMFWINRFSGRVSRAIITKFAFGNTSDIFIFCPRKVPLFIQSHISNYIASNFVIRAFDVVLHNIV